MGFSAALRGEGDDDAVVLVGCDLEEDGA